MFQVDDKMVKEVTDQAYKDIGPATQAWTFVDRAVSERVVKALLERIMNGGVHFAGFEFPMERPILAYDPNSPAEPMTNHTEQYCCQVCLQDVCVCNKKPEALLPKELR